MGAQAHFQGKNTAGSHTTVTEGARPVIETLHRLFPLIRITNGVIEGSVKARSFSIKFVGAEGGHKMTVVANSSKQQFYLYGAPSIEQVKKELGGEKKLRAYFINS